MRYILFAFSLFSASSLSAQSYCSRDIRQSISRDSLEIIRYEMEFLLCLHNEQNSQIQQLSDQVFRLNERLLAQKAKNQDLQDYVEYLTDINDMKIGEP